MPGRGQCLRRLQVFTGLGGGGRQRPCSSVAAPDPAGDDDRNVPHGEGTVSERGPHSSSIAAAGIPRSVRQPVASVAA
jgi:hypothetical protein